MGRTGIRHTGSRMLVATLVGYAAGAFPSADMAARMATRGRTDLRTAGSGNPGAANAIAMLGPRWGYGVLVADVAKGAAACRAGRRLAGDNGAHLAGVASVAGHCFPWYRGFKGGKGVATSAGQCLANFPAYFPLDLAVAGVAASRSWKQRAFATTAVASATWVGAAVVWWRRRWPNLWGPAPSPALPLSAAVTSAIIMTKFAAARPPAGAQPRPQPQPPEPRLAETGAGVDAAWVAELSAQTPGDGAT